MIRITAIFILLISASVTPGLARDWNVPDEIATLDAAFDSLGDGDRILVGPGEYTLDPIHRKDIGFSLIGSGGREVTTIRGTSDEVPIITIDADHKLIHFEGITFDRTTAGLYYSAIIGRASVEIADCAFIAGAGIQVDSCTGYLRGNLLTGCHDAMRILNSNVLIEKNRFEDIRQFGISTRGSEAEIYNNYFSRNGSTSILIVGKRRYPVIGGSPGKGNIFLQHDSYVVINDSRNEINARYNYWGAGVTSVMTEIGYPANVPAIFDKWDGENKTNGYVDYGDWLEEMPDFESSDVAATGREIPAAFLGGGLVLFALALFAAMKKGRRGA